MAEYRLAPSAERDLEHIWQSTAQDWGIAQAHSYIDKLVRVFETLADAPDRAAACDHIRVEYRRRHVERHALYFRKTASGIDIMRVLHDRMDATRHL